MRFVVSLVLGALCTLIGLFLLRSTLMMMVAAPLAVAVSGGLIYFFMTTGDIDLEDDQRLPRSTKTGRTITVMLGLFLGSLLGVTLIFRMVLGMF